MDVVNRLERLFVDVGFSIVYNLLCIGMNGVLSSGSSSIYLYIGDVVLRVGSFTG